MLHFCVFFFLYHPHSKWNESDYFFFILILFNSVLDQTGGLFSQVAISPFCLMHINFLSKNSVVVFLNEDLWRNLVCACKCGLFSPCSYLIIFISRCRCLIALWFKVFPGFSEHWQSFSESWHWTDKHTR